MRYCFPVFLFSLPYSIVAARRQARRFFKSKKQGILKAGLLTTCILTVALIAVDRLTSHGRHITHRKIILPLETSKQVEVSELISKNHSVPQKFCPEAPAGMNLSNLILLWFLTSLELCAIHSQHYTYLPARCRGRRRCQGRPSLYTARHHPSDHGGGRRCRRRRRRAALDRPLRRHVPSRLGLKPLPAQKRKSLAASLAK